MPEIKYETVFIAEPEITTEQVDQLINKVKDTIASHKGALTSEDRWGKRRLAYPLRGHREGFYTVLNFTAEPTVIMALEHLYNVTDSVIRQLTIRHYPSNKKFAPRREKPAGEAHRGPGRSSGGPRSRPDAVRPSAAPAAPAVESADSAPQGDK